MPHVRLEHLVAARLAARVLLPAHAMTALLPQINHVRHGLHRFAPRLQSRLERALPVLALDSLAGAGALDAQAVLDALLLLDLGVFGGGGHEGEGGVEGGEFEEVGLAAEGVVGCVPGAGARVAEGEEGVLFPR